MENAKHIGGIWALAVAVGIGMAVASTPAIASAKPADSDKGSTHDSGSTSSDTPSAKTSSDSNDTPRHHRGPKKPSDAADSSGTSGSSGNRGAPETSGTGTRKHRGTDSHPAAAATPPKTTRALAVVNTAMVNTAAVNPTVASPAAVSAAKPVQPVNPVSGILSTVVNALAFSTREFERAFVKPTTTVTSTPTVTTAAVDPSFISSTHGFFGLFSVTSAADPADNNYVAFVLRTPFFTNVLTSGTDPEDNLGLGAASIGVAGHTVNTFISPFGNFSLSIPVTDPLAPLFTALVRAGF
jgi:hypothetical protein